MAGDLPIILRLGALLPVARAECPDPAALIAQAALGLSGDPAGASCLVPGSGL